MTTAEAIRVSPDWLDLRERADAAARSRDLVPTLKALDLPGGQVNPSRSVVAARACVAEHDLTIESWREGRTW
jgi:hypothetical protein